MKIRELADVFNRVRYKKDGSKKRPSGEKVKLETNAPGDWPDVFVSDAFIHGDIQSRLLPLAVADALIDGFKAQGRSIDVSMFLVTKLHDEGVIEIPVEFTDGKAKTCVFVYPKADLEASANFSGAQQIFRDLNEPPPIYYSIGRLESVASSNPLRTFGADLLSRVDGKIPEGKYAMWWEVPGGTRFSDSQTIANIRRAYQALDGIESYVFASIMRSLGVIDSVSEKDAARILLPDKEATFLVKGPEGQDMILTAFQEKGIRFHFPIGTTSTQYRDRIWKLFADYAEDWRSLIEERGMEKDPADCERPIQWWSFH